MKTRVRRIIGFVSAILLIELSAILFLTPRGVETMFPPIARLNAESFVPSGNTYAVYYDIRAEVSQAELIVIGIDYGIAESYDLLGHFTRFVKQYNNISAVMMDMSISQQNVAQNVFLQDEEKSFMKRITTLRERTAMTSDCCDYITELFLVNRTVTAARKLNIYSYAPPTAEEYVMNAEELLSMSKAERIMSIYSSTERSALCVVDCDDLMYESELRRELDALAGDDVRIMYIQTQYSGSCADGEGHPEYRFPDYHTEPTVFFVDDTKAQWFKRYYAAILGSNRVRTESPLDTRYTEHYFAVTNGTNAE